MQLCIVHMIRNSTKYVSYKDLKEVTADLKKIYSATNEEEGVNELEKFTKKWDSKYPVISDIWRRNWSGISSLFAFPEEIRKAIYTTNIIEAANRQIRKIIKNKGVFPSDKSIQKIIYLALKNASKKSKALVQFLKSESDFTKFHKRDKFWFYDLLLLDILSSKNELGSNIFSSMFKAGDSSIIFKFLDEETSFSEDLQVIWRCPKMVFVKALTAP